ncbi:MAG: leucine-rich repeat protein [Ruminococcus sp.]|nr:leucine-rich repeat protein [Ruminococcus sp.]
MAFSGAAALPSGTLTKLFSFTASAQTRSGTLDDNATWTLDENGKLTISGTGEIRYLWHNNTFENNLSIRSVVIENGITSIPHYFFRGCTNLEKVSIADSVTDIGHNPFEGTKWLDEQRKISPFVIINDILLEANNIHNEVTIPNSVRVIGKSAFSYADIWKVYIPEGVEIIDWNAFTNCSQLTSINIPDSVHTIGSSAFMDCNLWSVQIGKGVKSIDSSAFYGNKNLSEITIPDNVETVEDTAFGNCTNLTSVNIGSGVKTLNPSSFSGCEKLEEINISKDNPYYAGVNGFVFNKEMTELALTPNEKECYIPEGVIRISKYMFDRNDTVEYVFLPETVKEIDEFGFYKCSQLKNISLPSKLERIIDISSCFSLESIVIPDSVTYIGQSSICGCDNLKTIELSCNPLFTELSFSSLNQNQSLKTIEIPQNIKTIGQHSFSSCESLESVTLYEGLKEIEYYAFLDCEKLKSIKIPKSVTEIDELALGYIGYNGDKVPDFTIYCYKDTEGERYAKDNGFKYVLLEECKHDYSVEKVPATCLKFGYDLHTCKKCGEKFKDNFTDLLGHDWSDWKQTEKPSCTKLGSDSRTCKHCGLTISRSVSKAQHSWSDWKVTEKPTASKFGLKERSCTVCGKTTTELMPKDESVKDIYRLAGKNRYETAANISSVSTPFSDNVVLACGMNYADALAGVPLANALNAPILLTEKDTLPKETLDEINRIKAKNVFLLGGEGAISADVEKALQDKSLKVERIAGSTRFETATKIAEKMQTVSGKAPSEVFFVYAFNFADALSASTAAAVKGAPIIYLKTIGEIDNATKSYLGTVKGKVKTAYVIGGSGVISNEMKSSAASALGLTSPASVQRIAGTDRYETCVAVNSTFNGVLTGNSFCIATGQDFPDALAGGVYAAQNKAPLFLVNGKEKTLRLSDAQAEFLKSKKTDSFYVFGGVGVVPDEHIQVLSKASA